jgi:hypothetical protein
VDGHEDGPPTPADATTQVLVAQPREERQLCATTMAAIERA